MQNQCLHDYLENIFHPGWILICGFQGSGSFLPCCKIVSMKLLRVFPFILPIIDCMICSVNAFYSTYRVAFLLFDFVPIFSLSTGLWNVLLKK